MLKVRTHRSHQGLDSIHRQSRRDTRAGLELAGVQLRLPTAALLSLLLASVLFSGAQAQSFPNDAKPAELNGSGFGESHAVRGTPSPAISVDPQSLSSTLPQGQTETRDLTVENIGGESLEWEVSQEARTTLTHSSSMDIQVDNSVGCLDEDGMETVESRYLRTFALDDFNITSEFHIAGVTFGIRSLTTTASITVNLYTLEGAFTSSNMTLIGTATEELSAQTLTLVTVPVTGTAPVGSTLVVEIVAPDFSFQQESFFPGMNDLGESSPSYMVSEECGILNPTTMADIGFPDAHLVMEVESADCTLPIWAGVTPLDGLVLGGGSQVAKVSFDATGLAPGDFHEDLCLSSNDSSQPLTVVPLVLRVTEGPEVKLDPPAIDFGAMPQGQQATPQAVTIENAGPGDVTLEALAIEGSAAVDFSLTVDACSDQTLTPGDSCGVEVGFTLTSPGVRTARLHVASNAPGSPHFVDLTGASDVLFNDRFEN
jgi:hypothetical protein